MSPAPAAGGRVVPLSWPARPRVLQLGLAVPAGRAGLGGSASCRDSCRKPQRGALPGHGATQPHRDAPGQGAALGHSDRRRGKVLSHGAALEGVSRVTPFPGVPTPVTALGWTSPHMGTAACRAPCSLCRGQELCQHQTSPGSPPAPSAGEREQLWQGRGAGGGWGTVGAVLSHPGLAQRGSGTPREAPAPTPERRSQPRGCAHTSGCCRATSACVRAQQHYQYSANGAGAGNAELFWRSLHVRRVKWLLWFPFISSYFQGLTVWTN